MNNNLVEEILEMEWELFTNLNNTGGRASCQDNKEEFFITRSSQWESLNEKILNSYLNDLYAAEEQGRNLLFEKYAHMMEFTHNEEYMKICMYLPPKDPMKEKIISSIEKIMMKWNLEFNEKYPKFSTKTRSMDKVGEDGLASARIYLIGEHKTYSYTTNLLYYDYISHLDYNLIEEIFTKIVKKKGFKDLDEAENSL